MEELNNRQIVLLTMLMSFVVSIATGIMTVAMLEEAPPTLTQTVNRVVERTIERVVTGSSTPEKQVPAPVTTVTKEVTVFAKEDDLIISAVEKNQPRIATIFSTVQATSSEPLAVGFIVSRDGVVIVDRASVATEFGLRESYKIMIGEKSYTAKPIKMKPEVMASTPVALLKISDMKEGDTLPAVTFGRQMDPKIAQTIIALGGNDGLGIFKSSLSKFQYIKAQGSTTPSFIETMETTPKIPLDYAGALVVNLDGQAVGIVVTVPDTTRLVVYPASRILDVVNLVSVDASRGAAESSEKLSAS